MMKNKTTNIIFYLFFIIILKYAECIKIRDKNNFCLTFTYDYYNSKLSECVNGNTDYAIFTRTRYCVDFDKYICDQNNKCKYKITWPIGTSYTGKCITKSYNEYLTYGDCSNSDWFEFNNGSIYTHNNKCLRIEYSERSGNCFPSYIIGVKGNKCGDDFKEINY